jgi:CO/xanthine dehydrogenase Mo-binding subunit
MNTPARGPFRPTGVAETGVTVVAGAIGNAIFDATGVRTRQVPFTADRIKAALMG